MKAKYMKELAIGEQSREYWWAIQEILKAALRNEMKTIYKFPHFYSLKDMVIKALERLGYKITPNPRGFDEKEIEISWEAI